jgi:hypothetical protein
MRNYIRVSIVITLLLVTVLFARNNVAWAGAARGATGVPQEEALNQSSVSPDKPEPGTVKPPPPEIVICEEGVHSVGGVATLEVTNLAPGYCLVAFLRDHAFAVGRIPPGAGEVLAPITSLRIFYYGKLVHELPEEDGQSKLCYAVPPGKTVQIYFLNFYGPRLGEQTGQPSWEPLDTIMDGGLACAAAQTTGAYALIGQ